MPSTCLSRPRPGRPAALLFALLAVAAITPGRAASAARTGSAACASGAASAGTAGSTASGAAQPPAAAARGIDLAAERAGLAATERAFARLSRQQGMRAAFLAYLADDAVIFRPGPVPGRPYMEAHPSPAIELTWAPSLTAVAASGDLGYTTGPYEVRATGPDRALEDQGYFVTVWRKQTDGSWKAVVDQGVATPPPGAADAAVLREPDGAAPGAAGAPAAAPSREAQSALLAAERAFGADAGAHGLRVAYLARLAPDARVYRDDALPAVGREAIGKTLAAGPQAAASWQVTAAGASAAGDLGFTYGTYADLVLQPHGAAPAGPPAAMYLHLWQRQADGSYQIVLDLVRALPPPKPPAAAAPPRQ